MHMQYSDRVHRALQDESCVGVLNPQQPNVVTGIAVMHRGVHVVRLQAQVGAGGSIEQCVCKACGCPATIACAVEAVRLLRGKHWTALGALGADELMARLALPRIRHRSAALVCCAAGMAGRRASELSQCAHS